MREGESGLWIRAVNEEVNENEKALDKDERIDDSEEVTKLPIKSRKLFSSSLDFFEGSLSWDKSWELLIRNENTVCQFLQGDLARN